ncbi:Tannase/feruloyl esterase [Fusarium flagelliforme]|uniref:Carboxylic ester hydrolase n=1 Tax=Fusarium flagelliforme TaxID=2675880 RepID=A0A395MHR5_9HYPO|nr:Tannase/feruloyl esterase [Fusarium flagelliforme]KAH7186098.1 Tannase/feruloyl esterase [Fusarium flagelliforme]RFN47310.1 carboxylic ester hydrolase [Fusarium flagelliforme]
MIKSLFNGTVPASACIPASIPYPSLFGAEFVSLEASHVANFSSNVPIGVYANHGAVEVDNVSYCNVTVSYTHPGRNDHVNVQVWLPTDTWNGRLQAIGGAGWQAGLHQAGIMAMGAAVGDGYATVSTDAGLGSHVNATAWALLSEGNVNQDLLLNLASTSINDASVIAKSVITSFYGQAPKYSYFTGCSQGGRQGMLLAQRYPEAYDGIAASAPGINWPQVFSGGLWGTFLMDKLGEYPPACEINAITDAALEACDGNDGVIDGVITDPNSCDFKAATVVGTMVNCTELGSQRPVSSAAATIVQGVWDGAKYEDGRPIWFGVSKGGALTGSMTDQALIPTSCSKNGTCTRDIYPLGEQWVTLFGMKKQNGTTANLSQEKYERLAQSLVQEYRSFLGTDDPDLSAFQKRGGKLISYHGTTDSIIPVNGTLHYYDSVAAQIPDVHDFYRVFVAPGVNHCFGGNGAYPDTTFDALRSWVEEGIAVDTLPATSVGITPEIKRTLCPYPKKQVFGGAQNSTTVEDSVCA